MSTSQINKYFSTRKPPISNYQFFTQSNKVNNNNNNYDYNYGSVAHQNNRSVFKNSQNTQFKNQSSLQNNFSFSVNKQKQYINPKLQYLRNIRKSIESLDKSIQNSIQHLEQSGIVLVQKSRNHENNNQNNDFYQTASTRAKPLTAKVKSDTIKIKFNYSKINDNSKKRTQLILNQTEKISQDQQKGEQFYIDKNGGQQKSISISKKLEYQNYYGSSPHKPSTDKQKLNNNHQSRYYQKLNEQSFQKLLGRSFDVDTITHHTQFSQFNTPEGLSPRNQQSFIKKQKSKQKLRKLNQRLAQLKQAKQKKASAKVNSRDIKNLQDQHQKILIMDGPLPSPIHKREQFLAKNASFIQAKSLRKYKNDDLQQQVQEEESQDQIQAKDQYYSYSNYLLKKNYLPRTPQQKNRSTQFSKKKETINWRKPKNYAQIQKLVSQKKMYRVDQIKNKFSPQKYTNNQNSTLHNHNHNQSYSYNTISSKSVLTHHCHKQSSKFDQPKQGAIKIIQFIKQMLKVKIIEKYMSITDLTIIYQHLKKSNIPQHKWKNFIIDQVYKKIKNQSK